MALTAGEEAAAARTGLVLLRYYQTLHSASIQTHKTTHSESDFEDMLKAVIPSYCQFNSQDISMLTARWSMINTILKYKIHIDPHRPTCLLFKFCIATPRLWPGSAALPNGSFRLGEGINGEVWASSASPASYGADNKRIRQTKSSTM